MFNNIISILFDNRHCSEESNVSTLNIRQCLMGFSPHTLKFLFHLGGIVPFLRNINSSNSWLSVKTMRSDDDHWIRR